MRPLYVLSEHIDHGFDDNGIQVAPLALVVNSSRWQQIEIEVNQHGHFLTEVTDSTETQATVFLHPKARKL